LPQKITQVQCVETERKIRCKSGENMPRQSSKVDPNSVLKRFADRDGTVYLLTHSPTKGRGFEKVFHVVFDEEVNRIADKLKSATSARIFMKLHNYLNWENFQQSPTGQLASALGLHQGTVSRCMLELEAAGAIERRGSGSMTTWRLTPVWGWHGTPAKYHKAMREYRKRHHALKVIENRDKGRKDRGQATQEPAEPEPDIRLRA
jgi:DNA-binding transcriptional ArsR family regulator